MDDVRRVAPDGGRGRLRSVDGGCVMAVVWSVVSVGLIVTERAWLLPAAGTAPGAGMLVDVPAGLAVASSCLPLSYLP